MIRRVLSKEVQAFIKEHEGEDPFQLGLKYSEVGGIPMSWVSEQILSRQKAKTKLPSWYCAEDIIFPPRLSMEQCSSEATANYKSSLVRGKIFVDLTGGAGVDAWALSRVFENGIYVEKNEELALSAKFNFSALGARHVSVINTTAEEFLEGLNDQVDCIYIDPARRDNNKNRVYLLEDCTPDITYLLPRLKGKAQKVLIKTSPMMDIDLSIHKLDGVSEVHVVAIDNDCKEVLYLISAEPTNEILVKTINFAKGFDQRMDFVWHERTSAPIVLGELKQYLYEPNSALLKTGPFNLIGAKFGLEKLHTNTHLYTSQVLVKNFPGRTFKVEQALPYSKKEINKAIPTGQANVTVRNFKDSVEKIRKKTGLRDGGEKYLFGFTDLNNKHQLALCTRI